MGVYRYSQEVHDFVKANCTKMRDKELAEACNEACGTQFTASTMKNFRANHKYRNGFGNTPITSRTIPGMREFIQENSWGVSSAEMAEMVNAKFGTDFNAHRMKVYRARYKISSGLTGWFQKGRPPGNKGRKQAEYCTPEALEASRRTQFPKGHRPKNELPIGAISKTRNGYLIQKVSMTGSQWERWKYLHRLIWEEQNGQIPKEMCLIFKNGNKEDCRIENLMLVRRVELTTMAKKGYYFTEPELTEAAVNLVRLQQTANKRKRGQNVE